MVSERSPYNNNIYIVYIIIAWAGSESNLYECVSGISETENETKNEIQLSTNGFNKWYQQIIYFIFLVQ